MAKLPALIDALESVDGRDRPTLEHIARVTRESGWIPTTKRGSGASTMNAASAANFLMAANGASSPKTAPEAVERLREMAKKQDTRSYQKPFESLEPIIGFGDALEYLIENFSSFAEHYGVDAESMPTDVRHKFSISIEINFGYSTIRIRNENRGHQDFYGHFRMPIEKAVAIDSSVDRRVTVTFGEKTIAALWRCVAGLPLAERE